MILIPQLTTNCEITGLKLPQHVAIALVLVNDVLTLLVEDHRENLASERTKIQEEDPVAGSIKQIILENGCIVSDVSYLSKEVDYNEKAI